jgi:hypothetical protein
MGEQIPVDEMGAAHDTHVEEEKFTEGFGGDTRRQETTRNFQVRHPRCVLLFH